MVKELDKEIQYSKKACSFNEDFEANSQQPTAISQFFTIDLQLFADEEKTEKATPRKRQEARKKGQVFQSKEINSAVLLLAMFFTIKFSSPFIYNQIKMYFENIFNNYMKVEDIFAINTFMKFSTETSSTLENFLGLTGMLVDISSKISAPLILLEESLLENRILFTVISSGLANLRPFIESIYPSSIIVFLASSNCFLV